ncbi:MAG: SecDF P1 head subdomain-containing protein [Gemmatimonadales bacterium]
MIFARFLVSAVCFSLVTCVRYQAADRGRLLIDVRLARDTAESGFMPMRSTSDTIFYLDRAHVVSDTDIQFARVLLREEGFLIRARLTPSANSRHRTFLQQHVGERLAVILDGQLIGAPIIRIPPSDAQPSSAPYHLEISAKLADSTTQRIKALITTRWPVDSQ